MIGRLSDDFPTFEAFIEAAVLPVRAQHPTRRRLDGWPSGGNWEIAGRFWHAEALWTVHADSHFEPLLLAYEAARRGEEPFIIESTQTRRALNLRSAQRAQMSDPRFKYIYIYESEPRPQ
jgi:hypothetical protein